MKLSFVWLVPPLLIALCGLGSAAETKTTKDAPPATEKAKTAPKKAKKPAAQKFRGEITAVDVKAGTLSAKTQVSEKNFVAQEAAKESLERISVGDRVKITYTEKEGKLYASTVRRLKVKNADTTKSQKDAKKSEKESASAAKTPAKESTKATK